ncbi:hypothetical protein F4679DRAFT_49596 [Xylaria curta]|nr:hypothetical protein F4679DRAFT_49596 [Xylaria curta]
MSRSLDKGLLSQLKLEDPKPAYNDLSNLFANNLPESGLLEIEFLGQSHPLEPGVNFLRDENAIAIPKLRLVQAFFVARQILQRYLEHANGIITEDVTAATSILLLMDPEHLTAANIRKRALSVPSNLTQATLKKEKWFVDTLLTARLHRHTKSPTLWSHRRWLVTTSWTLGTPWDIGHDIQNVIMVAAASVACDVKEFCLKNHSDISGWAFLSDCITRIQDEESRRLTCSSVLDDALSMAESFRWTNESVWVFLRTVVARECVGDQDFKRFIATNDKLSITMSHNTPEWMIMERAREWCNRYRVPKSCQI